MEVNRLTLEFSGDNRALEKEFTAYYFENSLIIFRLAIATGIGLYGIFGILDGILVPEIKHQIWFIRYVIVCPIFFIGLATSFSSHFRIYWQGLSVFLVIVAGLGILVMIIIVPPPINYFYYAGLMLVTFFCYAFIKIKFMWATMTGWIIVALYQVVAIWISQSPSEVIIRNNFFFISANILGMFACYSIEYTTRKNFYFSCLLKNEKNTVATINTKLEKKVLELSDALDKIKILSGLVPICAECKKIRDDQGFWNNLESYIEKHSDVLFSHGICPKCSSKLYGDKDWYKKLKKDKKD